MTNIYFSSFDIIYIYFFNKHAYRKGLEQGSKCKVTGAAIVSIRYEAMFCHNLEGPKREH